jgi:hypothetical protein
VTRGRVASLTGLRRFVLASALIGLAVSYSTLYLFHIALLTFCVACVWRAAHGDLAVRLPADRSHWYLYAFFAWYAASVAWSIDPASSVQYLFYLVCGISVVLTTISLSPDEAQLRSTIKLACAVIAVEVLCSLLEIATPFRLPVSPYSSYAHYFGREPLLDISLDQRIIQQFLSSPTGFQWNPNDLAVTLVIFLPFVLFQPKSWSRHAGSIAMLVVILFTGSRASCMGAALVILLWGVAFSLKRAAKTVCVLVLIAVIAPAAMSALENSTKPQLQQVAHLSDAVLRYLSGDSEVEEDSIGLRRQLIRNGLDALADSGWIGVGGGGSKVVQERAGGHAAFVKSMHNFWIEVFVDGGVAISFSFYIWFAWITIRTYAVAMLSRNSYLKYAAAAITCSLVGFSVALISSSSVVYVLPMWLMFGIACAVLNVHARAVRQHADASSPAAAGR